MLVNSYHQSATWIFPHIIFSNQNWFKIVFHWAYRHIYFWQDEIGIDFHPKTPIIRHRIVPVNYPIGLLLNHHELQQDDWYLFTDTYPILSNTGITFNLTTPNKNTVTSFNHPLLDQIISAATTQTFAVIVPFGGTITKPSACSRNIDHCIVLAEIWRFLIIKQVQHELLLTLAILLWIPLCFVSVVRLPFWVDPKKIFYLL